MKRQTWAEIKGQMKSGTRTRLEAEASLLSDELHLSELRKARGLTQESVAELLGVSQAEVSKMERRSELHIGTSARSKIDPSLFAKTDPGRL